LFLVKFVCRRRCQICRKITGCDVEFDKDAEVAEDVVVAVVDAVVVEVVVEVEVVVVA
jgi:hypothetical protein